MSKYENDDRSIVDLKVRDIWELVGSVPNKQCNAFFDTKAAGLLENLTGRDITDVKSRRDLRRLVEALDALVRVGDQVKKSTLNVVIKEAGKIITSVIATLIAAFLLLKPYITVLIQEVITKAQ